MLQGSDTISFICAAVYVVLLALVMIKRVYLTQELDAFVFWDNNHVICSFVVTNLILLTCRKKKLQSST